MFQIEAVTGVKIVGLKTRTTNERAFEEIPSHWQRFFSEGGPTRIPGAISDTVYAVYADFEHEGRDNQGTYSFIIGAEVPASAPVPEGLVGVEIPTARRAVFPVEKGHPEKVGDEWRKIWATDLPKTFVCDYEKYEKEGVINIFVGVR
jgi:predicted transcriptional regulator YdeE